MPWQLDNLNTQAADLQSSLFWYAYREWTPYSYPNVIYTDFVGQPYALPYTLTQDEYMKKTTSHLAALAMAVNLQIVSQNCNAGGGRI
jgi:hypothetical protein